MASRNEVKIYAEGVHYHVYNRGVNGMTIFQDEEDFSVFLNLLKRHLSPEPKLDKKKRSYIWLTKDIELEAFCLMGNHFHLLFYQNSQNGLPRLLQAIIPTYVGYFNKKYKRYGPLLQGVYKASLIYTDSYIEHITRYIHLNPRLYRTYEWSSYACYVSNKRFVWLHPERITSIFKDQNEYRDFVADHEDFKLMLDEIKHELADHKTD